MYASHHITLRCYLIVTAVARAINVVVFERRSIGICWVFPSTKSYSCMPLEIFTPKIFVFLTLLLFSADEILCSPSFRNAISHRLKFNRNYSAFSEGKLVPWLRLVLKYQPLVESIYQPWSCTLSPGQSTCFDIIFSSAYLYIIYKIGIRICFT